MTRALSPSLAGLAGARPAAPRRSVLARLVAAAAMGRSRRALADLDPWLLEDIGVTRAEARAEAARPAWDGLDARPWDAPAHWLR